MTPRKRTPEVLDDLIAARLAKGQTVTGWCIANGLPYRTIGRLRRGIGKPHVGTLLMLANALGLGADVARVRAAIEAARN